MRIRILVLAAALALPCTSCLESERSTDRRIAPWDEFNFRSVRTSRGRSFNLVLTTPALPGPESEVRLLFELQPDNANYYYVSVTREGLTLGKVECGVELPLADWGDADGEPFSAKERRVTVVRRPGRIAVAVDNRKILDANDDTYEQGGAAVGAKGPAASAPEVSMVRASEIYAADDFMRAKDEVTVWRTLSGMWEIESINNPGLSANAFVYSGYPAGSEPAASILGESWWDDYSFEVSAKPVAGAEVALLFRYVDQANHYAFRQASKGSLSSLQLVRVEAGGETILKEVSGGLRPGQWGRLRVAAFGPRLAGYVDGRRVLTAKDSTFAFGMIGLRVAGEAGADFDDVSVRGHRGIIEDFRSGAVVWQSKGGDWAVRQAADEAALNAVGPPSASAVSYGKLLAGHSSWADCRLVVKVKPGATGTLGIITRYQDESDHDLFLCDTAAGKYSFVLVRGGASRVAATTSATPIDSVRTLSVRLAGGMTICEADGARVLTHFSMDPAPGKVGLCVGKESAVAFRDLAVTFPEQAKPVLTKLDTFAAETTMANWAAAKSDWRAIRTGCWGERLPVMWHRGGFPGDASMQVGALFDAVEGGSLQLFICCDMSSEGTTRELKSGYRATVRSQGHGGSGGTATLTRNGEEIASKELETLQSNSRIVLRKVVDHVIVEINGEAVLAFNDESPLAGWSAGYAADNVLVKPEDVDVFCRETVSYSFVRAAADWRTAGGEWLVTNRWRCDPRWSFFGGESKTGVSAIWHKSTWQGDLNVEFAAGIRHQARRRGTSYEHASDMNLVICGDGSSLASGYGFVFGGWNNTKTAITRNGRVVAEAGEITIPSKIHRRWFYFKATKRGGLIRYYIDHKLVLEYSDPRPLPDGQIALWTWQNGLMVARVRIAAERIGAKEKFDLPVPAVSKSMYGG